MIRVALTILLPMIAPTAIYFLWLYAAGRAAPARGLAGMPWTWLIVGGLAAAALALVVVGIATGGSATGSYVPPHLQGGTVVPGQIVPPGGR